jgi:acyl-CoA synthetase (AMP-forming)/AMP-acid ligase II
MPNADFCSLAEAALAAPPQRRFVTVWKGDDDVQTVSFGGFFRLAKWQAANFHTQGLEPGDRVILIMPQGIDLMAAFAGAMLLGAIPAILAYPNFKADPAKYNSGLTGISENLRARLVVVDDGFPSELSARLALVNGTRLLRSSAGSVPSTEPRLPTVRLDYDAIAFIQHSAGTTGLQKGVALTHRAVLTQLQHLVQTLDIGAQDSIYSWLPLYHDMGLIACFMLPLVYHVPVVMQSPIDWVVRPGTMLQLISDYRCTLAWVPNFALQFLARRVRQEDRGGYNLATLRALINCSEPVRAQSMDEFIDAFEGCGLKPEALKSSYAMAENVFAVTQSAIDEAPCRVHVDARELLQKNLALPVTDRAKGSVCLVSSGRCMSGNQVRIVSSEGRDLADGEVGEILIQSDSLFDGYYNRPELGAKAFQGGWYFTGDLAFRIAGELYVIGRKKDLIIVAGKNIYPQDIEEIVCRHPAIHDGRAVAFGLYNAGLGTEEVIVAAELEKEVDPEVSYEIERAIRSAIAAELDVAPRAIYLKSPSWIVKSTAGKPARSITREKLLAEHAELMGG